MFLSSRTSTSSWWLYYCRFARIGRRASEIHYCSGHSDRNRACQRARATHREVTFAQARSLRREYQNGHMSEENRVDCIVTGKWMCSAWHSWCIHHKMATKSSRNPKDFVNLAPVKWELARGFGAVQSVEELVDTTDNGDDRMERTFYYLWLEI